MGDLSLYNPIISKSTLDFTLIDLFGTWTDLFFKSILSLYICTTIALVGKVCGRFGAKKGGSKIPPFLFE
jgi:hypothetical protein